MSSIDERVVAMKFNNGQFESGVKQTMSSLDGLKKGLNLDASTKSLDGLDAAGKRFSLQGMADGIQTVASKFNALSVIGITALANITNKAINAGTQLVKSITVAPIMDGLKEYETQLNSVQTIMANTASKGSTMQNVNDALAELNTYADMTIYNFGEMARNIGTFTAAGVDLETSTSAIKGIANVAALSGSTSEQASTAMYQLSQAISAGSVKLQDWNSVVNAGMGGEVMQEALKETARVHGVAVDGLIEKNGSFRESLQEGWITSDILTETLSKFTGDLSDAQLESMGYTSEQIAGIQEMAKTASDAATKVKTMTQLIDTLQEASGSGWAQTWQIIFGDFEEAKELFTGVSTVLGGMIDASSDARNKMVQDWKDLGGRKAAIDVIRYAFEALMGVFEPIQAAFKEIFPPTTGAQLFAITDAIRTFMLTLMLSAESQDKIKRTFKGLFAVLDVGVFIIMKIVSVISTLLKVIFQGSGGVLTFTGNIGDMLVKFRDMVKSGTGVTTFFNTIQRVLILTIVKIKQFVAAIFSLGAGFKGLDLSSFSSAIEGLGNRLNPMARIGENVAKIWEKLKGALSGLISFFAPFASTMGKLFGGIGKSISDSVQDMDFNAILDLINTGLLAGIVLLIRKFLKGGVPDVGGGLVDSIKDVFDGLTDTMGAMQTQLKAGTLVKIATAIAVLTASVLVLSMIDSGALTKALMAITVMFGQLFVSMAIFEKATATAGFAKMPLVAASMILLGTAILILTAAVTILSKLSWEDLAKGLLGVTVLLKGLTTAVQSMAANPAKLISTGVGLMALAVAVKILASAVKDFSGMSWADMAQGLVGVGVILGALTLFTKLAQVNKGAVAQSAGLILLGVALKVLASAVADFAAIPASSMVKGLGAVGIVLAEVALFTNLTGNAKGVMRTAASMVILGAALKIFANVMSDFAGMSWEDIGKGMTGIAGALLIIAGAMHLMPKNMILTATSLVIVGAALKIITEALKNMGGMSWEEIGKSMVVLAGSLAILAGAMYLMTAALPGALSLIIVAGALAILTPALISMSKLSWEEIAKGLSMLAGVFLVIGLAGLALTPVIPSLIGLGVAVVLLGAGAMLAGVGILAMAVGITALSVAAAAGTAGIVTLVSGVLGLIPMALEALGEGIIAFAKVIEAGVPAIVSAIVAMVLALLGAIVEMAPAIGEAFVTLIFTLLDVIIEATPRIVEAIVVLLTGLLDVVIRMTPVVVAVFTTLIGSILDSIRTLIPKAVMVFTALVSSILTSIKILIPQGVAIFTAFIVSLLTAIRTIQPQVVATFVTMILSLLNAIRAIGPQIVDTFIETIRSILRGVITISGEIVDTFVTLVHMLVDTLVAGVPYLVDSGMKLILGVLNGINNNIRRIVTVGMEILTNLLRGISDGLPGLTQAGADVVVTFVESLGTAIRNNQARMDAAGRDLAWAIADGMTGGLASKVGEVVEGAKNLAANAIEGAKNLLGIHSPSRVFFGLGQNTGEGYINGLDHMGRAVERASENMGHNALDGIKTSIGKVAEFMSTDIDFAPTITPVLDLDDLRREASGINSMLNGQPFSLEAGYASAADISRASRQEAELAQERESLYGEDRATTIYNQYNNSPKSLSNFDIYRKTKTQLAQKVNPKGVKV